MDFSLRFSDTMRRLARPREVYLLDKISKIAYIMINYAITELHQNYLGFVPLLCKNIRRRMHFVFTKKQLHLFKAIFFLCHNYVIHFAAYL